MTLLSTVTPRQDVMAGELTESRFAAGLEDVASGTAADTYGPRSRSSRRPTRAKV